MRKFVTKVLALITGRHETPRTSTKPIVVRRNPRLTEGDSHPAATGNPKTVAIVFHGDTDRQHVEVRQGRCCVKHPHLDCPFGYDYCGAYGCQAE